MNAENYLRWARFTWWNYKLFAQQLANSINKASKILDVGCSNGLLLDELKVFFPNSTVVGVDASKNMLTIRNQENPVVVGKSEYLPFKDGVFDLVVCMYSLHEFQIEKAIEEIYRVLKDGGFLSVKEINCEAPKWALMYLKFILNLFFDKKTIKDHLNLYSSFKKPEILIRILEGSGFKILDVKKGLLDFVVICTKASQ